MIFKVAFAAAGAGDTAANAFRSVMGKLTFKFDPAAGLAGKCMASGATIICDEKGISDRVFVHELGHIFDVRANTGGRSKLKLEPIVDENDNIIAGGSPQFVRSCSGYITCDYPTLQHPPNRFPNDDDYTKSYEEFGDMFLTGLYPFCRLERIGRIRWFSD